MKKIIFFNISILIQINICVLSFVTVTNGEVYTALVDMVDVINVEEKYIKNLEDFVSQQENCIEFVKNKLVEYKKKHKDAKLDIETYVKNPINSYLLIKRLTSDWQSMQSVISNKIEKATDILETLNKTSEIIAPNDNDLIGAASALIRLQEMYQLTTSDIVNGILNGIKSKNEIKMTASDCYQLGVTSYDNKNYPFAIQWFEEAIHQLKEGDSNLKINILRYLSLVNFEQGKYYRALNKINKILKMNPYSEYDWEIKKKIEDKMHKLNVFKKKEKNGSKSQDEKFAQTIEKFEQEQYEKLCRQRSSQYSQSFSQLSCHYVTNNNPFLIIGPLKIEEYSLDPYIVVYHDAIYNSEINYLKSKAKDNFKIAQSKSEHIRQKMYNRKEASIIIEDHKKINQRVSDMTQFSTINSEPLQIVNYGIGGHYGPHFDHFKINQSPKSYTLNDDRMATLMFYMSDVEAGGATVFPYIDVAVLPLKGTALFWYNLQESHELDIRLRHASCPILFGDKWVANQWLQENDQSIKRPYEFKLDREILISGLEKLILIS